MFLGKRLIKEVPTSSLPRERMEIYGAEALSDQELLAILLRTGQHPYSVMSIAGNLLKRLEDWPLYDRLLCMS